MPRRIGFYRISLMATKTADGIRIIKQDCVYIFLILPEIKF